jgi:hypothetical protein
LVNLAPPPLRTIRPRTVHFRSGRTFIKVICNGELALAFRYGDEAVSPLDHHSENSSDRGCYYCSLLDSEKDDDGILLGFKCSLLERFSRVQEIDLANNYQFALIQAESELSLLDLRTDIDLNAAGARPEAIYTDAFHLSQSWSRHFYEQTEQYGKVDGLIYATRDYKDRVLSSVVFYERAGNKLRELTAVLPFTENVFSKMVYKIAEDHHIEVIVPDAENFSEHQT